MKEYFAMGQCLRIAVLLFIFLSVAACAGINTSKDWASAKTFVLVHGAWVGEWTWEPVAQILRDNNHQVFNVSLKGQGKRRAEYRLDITLEDHVRDVQAVLESNDLSEVYLVGHSYGGKVITGAWDRARERIHHAVYVDAFAPIRKGPNPFFSTNLKPKNPVASAQEDENAKPRVLPFPKKNSPIAVKTVAMPLTTVAADIQLSEPLPADTFKSFVFAGNNGRGVAPSGLERNYYQPMLKDKSWIVYRLPTGHNVMEEMPEVMAAILMNSK